MLTANVVARGEAGPLWFLVKFALGYVMLHVLYFMLPDAVLRDVFIQFALAVPAAGAIDFVSPQQGVRAAQGVLTSPRAVLEIVRGCDGTGAAFLLTAAIVAYPGTIRRKLAGVALGLALVYIVNQVRIVGLYFVVAYRESWFLFLHTFLAPLAVIVTVALFFGWWVMRVPRSGAIRSAAA